MSEPTDKMTIEEVVDEYQRLKNERSAIEARIEALRSRIEEYYNEATLHEGETIEVSTYTLQFVNQSRKGIWTKKEFASKYGPNWVKNHIKTTWHSRMNLKPKKDS